MLGTVTFLTFKNDIEVRDVRDDSHYHFYTAFDHGEAQLNRSETLRRGFGVKGTLPWEHREDWKRYFSLMVTSAESNIRSVSEGLLLKAGRLILRLFLALSLVAAITFVFFRLIHVNYKTPGKSF